MHEMTELGGSSKVSPLAPIPSIGRSKYTYPLVVIHYNASGANGEGSSGTHALTQGQVLLGFWPPNAHL